MGDKLKGLAKGGWHPESRKGGKESFRKDMKGIDQISGWMGKKAGRKDPEEERRAAHTSRPLNSLRDRQYYQYVHVTMHLALTLFGSRLLRTTAQTLGLVWT